jgi:DNA-binding CsgD family transcriptional regulator
LALLSALLSTLLFLSLASCADKTPQPAFYLNLQDFPLYLKTGFNPVDIKTPDFARPEWRELRQWTNVILSKPETQALLQPRQAETLPRAFLSPFGRTPREWTIAIPFTLDNPPPLFPGIFLAAIGENWQIYLNGVLVHSEMHVTPEKRITEHHSQREVFFPLRRELFRSGENLKAGDNLLVFRIAGDPTDQTVGFQYAAPYYLADYEYIVHRNSEILEFVFIGIYLLVGFYHILIFLIQRKEKYHIFGGVFSFGMGLYYLARTHGIYDLIPDTLIVVKLEFFCVFLMIPSLMIFTELLCRMRVTPVSKIYSGCIAFLAVTQLVFPHPYGSDALIVWQVSGIAAMLWILVRNILLPFAAELKKVGKVQAALWDSYPGNLLVGVGIITFTIIADLLDALIFHYSIGFTRYGFLAFVLSVAVMLARLYGKAQRELAAQSELVARQSALLAEADPAQARERVFAEHNLSERESEVARLILEGLDNRQIAARLFVSEATVEFHVSGIFRKFGVEGKRRPAFLGKFVGKASAERR